MTPEQIKAEHDRLRPILFEGAPDWATHAFKFHLGQWFLYGHNLPNPLLNEGRWRTTDCGRYITCKNQPETTLNWKDTLIKRGDV